MLHCVDLPSQPNAYSVLGIAGTRLEQTGMDWGKFILDFLDRLDGVQSCDLHILDCVAGSNRCRREV